MELVNLFFSFQGRIGRRRFWHAILTYVIAVAAVWALSLVVSWYYVMAAVALIVYLPSLFSFIAVGVKRLHDRNKASPWLLVFYLVPIAGLSAAGLFETGTLQSVDFDHQPDLPGLGLGRTWIPARHHRRQSLWSRPSRTQARASIDLDAGRPLGNTGELEPPIPSPSPAICCAAHRSPRRKAAR